MSTETLAMKQSEDMLANRREHYKALSWSKETLQHMRNKRLRDLLAHAKSNSPWYKKVLADVDISIFTEQDLYQLPTLDKATLMSHWDDIVTDRRLSLSLAEQHIDKMREDGDTLYLMDRYHVLATSGSSGTRGVFIYDWHEWNTFYIHHRRYPILNTDRSKPLFRPTQKITLAMVVVSNTVFAMYALSKTFQNDNLTTYHFPITEPLNDIVAGLNKVQADILQGTPTTIHKLCLEARAGRLNIQPKMITVGGEALYTPIRQLIKTTWPNAHIFNTLGSSEGIIGVNCHADSLHMHLNEDACIIQPVDTERKPVHKGSAPHKLILTNLYNYTLPLICYEFTDRLQFLDETCECGVQHQLIAEPQGRPEFDFMYDGELFVHHLTFVTPLLHEKNVLEYQVVQTKSGATIKLSTIGPVDHNRLKHTIERELLTLGLSNPVINVIEVDHFDYPESGKLRRFLSLQSS